jgi:hypothetical protein
MMVWKQLVGQKMTLDDLEEFDDGFVTYLNGILNADPSNVEEFDSLYGGRHFTTALSDSSVVELEQGGSKKLLTLQNRVKYVRKSLYTRMKECEAQCEAIKRGIC